jgi:nucleotide-binding universal stress UspA family protein
MTLLLCYDGSENAKHACRRAGELFARRSAMLLVVWETTAVMGSQVWAGSMEPMLDYSRIDRAAADAAGQRAEEGLAIARGAGLNAAPLVVQASGAVWKTIVDVADEHDAAIIVMGSRGLTGVRSLLLGSVSGHVVHHAGRPVLVVPAGD